MTKKTLKKSPLFTSKISLKSLISFLLSLLFFNGVLFYLEGLELFSNFYVYIMLLTLVLYMFLNIFFLKNTSFFQSLNKKKSFLYIYSLLNVEPILLLFLFPNSIFTSLFAYIMSLILSLLLINLKIKKNFISWCFIFIGAFIFGFIDQSKSSTYVMIIFLYEIKVFSIFNT